MEQDQEMAQMKLLLARDNKQHHGGEEEEATTLETRVLQSTKSSGNTIENANLCTSKKSQRNRRGIFEQFLQTPECAALERIEKLKFHCKLCDINLSLSSADWEKLRRHLNSARHSKLVSGDDRAATSYKCALSKRKEIFDKFYFMFFEEKPKCTTPSGNSDQNQSRGYYCGLCEISFPDYRLSIIENHALSIKHQAREREALGVILLEQSSNHNNNHHHHVDADSDTKQRTPQNANAKEDRMDSMIEMERLSANHRYRWRGRAGTRLPRDDGIFNRRRQKVYDLDARRKVMQAVLRAIPADAPLAMQRKIRVVQDEHGNDEAITRLRLICLACQLEFDPIRFAYSSVRKTVLDHLECRKHTDAIARFRDDPAANRKRN